MVPPHWGQFVIGLDADDDDDDDDDDEDLIRIRRCDTNVMGYLCFRLRDCLSLINGPMDHLKDGTNH